MEVRIVTTHLSYVSAGSFYRPYEMAKQSQESGVRSRILTPFEEDTKNFTDVPMITLPNISQKFGIGSFANETLRRIIYNKYVSRKISYDKLLLLLSEKIARALEKSLDSRSQILQGEQEVAALASIKVAKKIKIPVITDMHNIWAEELVSMGYLKRETKTFRNLMDMERFIIENSDGVIVVNEFMKDYLICNFEADPRKITLIPPGGEILIDSSNKKNKEERLAHKKVIYGGTVTPREHVDLFIRSIPYVSSKHPNTRFIVSEKGESVKEIKDLCRSISVKPQFYWFKSRKKARDKLKKCYIGILPSANDTARKLGTPLKLLEYISLGLPVVANYIGSWCDIIKDYKVGVLTRDDPRDFAEGICTLLEDEHLYRSIQRNMMKLLKEKFNWKIQVERKLIPLYQKLLS